jgi:hypothetical protein
VKISVELFNSLCILPATNWGVCLSANGATASVEASLLDRAPQDKFLLDLFSTARRNIVSIVEALLQNHHQGDLIRSYARDEIAKIFGDGETWGGDQWN